MNKFESYKLSNELLKAIHGIGITEPTEIQEKSIPHVMEGKDVVGESATGSGKTLAFGCSIVDHIVSKNKIQALILTPTRELCEQVKDSLKVLGYHKRLKVIAIYGGVSISPQMDHLRTADVVVATPGRLLDHMERRTIDLSHVKILVLDEADRMLDMGFMDDVEKIVRACPRERQTMFFSATIHPRIRSMAKKYMNNPIQVNAKNQVDPSKLKQEYYDVTRNNKVSLLVHLLKSDHKDLVMVFCNSRRVVDFVVKNLKGNGVNAIAIHGGFTQNKRSKTLEMFNNATVGVMVCTDVAARGLHIDNVSHIYNYDVPVDPKDYVHRIGRTARAGEEGKVVNLICDYDYENFGRIERDYREFKIEKMEKPVVENVKIFKEAFGERRGGPPHRGGGPKRRFGGGNFGGPRRGGFSGPKRSFGNRREGSSGPKRSFSHGGHSKGTGNDRRGPPKRNFSGGSR